MTFGNPQLWLILWKDYIIRKRKPITLVGIAWAAATIISLVIVRYNVFQDEKPTCQFSSRALPSIGVLPFLQSFICTVNNDCNPLDQYETVPKYTNSGLTAIQDEFLPIFENETIFESVEILPNSVKLLSTVFKIIDNKGIHDIIYKGFRISDIFKNPDNVISLMNKQFKVPRWIFKTLMNSPIKIENIVRLINSSKNLQCNKGTIDMIFLIENMNDSSHIANMICNIKWENLGNSWYNILYEVDVDKYVEIIDDIIYKLTSQNTVKKLGNMLTSLIQLSNIENYIPDEFRSNTNNTINNRRYLNVTLIKNFFIIFESHFKTSGVYKTILNTVDIFANSLRFLNNFVNNESSKNNLSIDSHHSDFFNDKVKSFVFSIENILGEKPFSSDIVLNTFGKLMDTTLTLLPEDTKHTFFYYITLIDKLLSGTHNLIHINFNMEEIMYNVSTRHPMGIAKISKLGPDILNRIIDGLSDASRVQIFTNKIYHPGQMFCDLYKIQTFLKISKQEASRIKPIICDSAWKNFVIDIVDNFGINNISSTISQMASLVISETINKASESRFIKIEHFLWNLNVFFSYIFKNFPHSNYNNSHVDWKVLFKDSNFTEIKNLLTSKSHKVNLLLITVNTALARQVISNNPVLDTYLSQTLNKLKTILKAATNEIDNIPLSLTNQIQKYYFDILESILLTLKDKNKILNILTSNFTSVFCELDENCKNHLEDCDNMMKRKSFIQFPLYSNTSVLLNLFCNISSKIAAKLNSNIEDDILINTIQHIDNNSNLKNESNVNWNELITIIQELYVKINIRVNFIFQSNYTGLQLKKFNNIKLLTKDLQLYMKNNITTEDSLKISISCVMSVLQIFDSSVFGLTRTTNWTQIKNDLDGVNSIIFITNQLLQTAKALTMKDRDFVIENLPITSSHIKDIVLNLPDLIRELAVFITDENNNVQIFIDALNNGDWPCNNSITNAMMMNEEASSVIKAVEALLCINRDLNNEWRNFTHFSKIFRLIPNNTNYQPLTPELFRKTSITINKFISHIFSLEEFISELNFKENFKNFRDDITNSWIYATHYIHANNKSNQVLRRFFENLDTLLSSIPTNTSLTPSGVWESYTSCKTYNDDDNMDNFKKCRKLFWDSLKYSTLYISEAGVQMASDLTEYFNEIGETHVNVLQLIGFTKKTGLYTLFDKLPDFLDVLVNSFLDEGYMKQIYRSLGQQFWDCERILSSFIIPSYSRITEANIENIKPYICPSFVYWVSIPTDENVLLDIFAKSQLIFFSKPVSDYNSTFEKLYEQSSILYDKLDKFSKKKNTNFTFITDDWIDKFTNIGKTLIFNDDDDILNIFKTQSIFKSSYVIDTLNVMYLSEITKIMINTGIQLKHINESEPDISKYHIDIKDLKTFIKYMERKSKNILEIFLYSFTEELLTISNPSDFNITASLNRTCYSQDSISETWMKSNNRILKSFCKTNYKVYFQILNDRNIYFEELLHDFINATVVIGEIMKNDLNENFTENNAWKQIIIDVVGIYQREPNKFLRKTIEYAYDLKLTSYYQYLNMKLDHYLITLTFLNGNQWWPILRHVYNKPNSKIILDFVEKSPIILDDIVDNLPKIKIIRFIKDMKYNNTMYLCGADFSEYFPDNTGLLSELKTFLCQLNVTELYKEIKLLSLAAEIYDSDFISEEKEIIYIDNRNEKLTSEIVTLLKFGSKKGILPTWITPNVEKNIKNINMRLNTESGEVDIVFFIFNNFMDTLTLYMNSSISSIPSTLTPWIKQIKLQLIKSSEYVTFLCDLKTMGKENIYQILVNEFHWDIALSEILSNRNYTWLEMNKAVYQLSELIRQQIHNTGDKELIRLNECFFEEGVISNPLQKISIYIMLGSNIIKLIEASAPHFKNINNFHSHPLWQHLFSVMKNDLPIYINLKNVYLNHSSFSIYLNDSLHTSTNNNIYDVSKWEININKIVKNCINDSNEYCYEIKNNDLISNISHKSIDTVFINKRISDLQYEEFWSLKWFSKVIASMERLLWNLSHVTRKISILDWNGLNKFKINSILDFILQFTQKTFSNDIVFYANNILFELKPLISNFDIGIDAKNVVDGLNGVRALVDNVFDNINPKFEIKSIFQNWNRIKTEIVSKTNISTTTMDTLQMATLNLKPLLDADNDNIHINDYVCKQVLFTTIFQAKNVNLSTLNEAQNQFCNISSDELQTLINTLIKNINITTILNGGAKFAINQIMSASNLTKEDGEKVMGKINDIITLIPLLREIIGNVSRVVQKQPIIKSLQKSSKFSDLLKDPNFFNDIGNMLCGKPFIINTNRFYKVIAGIKSVATEPDQKHLNSLPSDYCRELYREILQMDGGKILWSYTKPLLMGKILYTPNTPDIKNILANANESFTQIARIFHLIQDFSSGLSNFDEIIEYKSSFGTIQKLLNLDFLRNKLYEFSKINISMNNFNDFDLDDFLDHFENMTLLQKTITSFSNMIKCIQLDRFLPVESETILEEKAMELTDVNEFLAGIVFMNNNTSQSMDIQYKIRMDIDNVPSTSRIKSRFWVPGPNSNFIENLRYFRGFVQLQDIIDKAIITSKYLQNTSIPRRNKRNIYTNSDNVNVTKWGIYTQQMPYPCHVQDEFKTILYESQALIIAFFFSLILVVASVVRNLIWERESGNILLMCVMRMKRKNHTLSWFIISLIEVLFTMIVLCFILKVGNILPKSNPFVVLLVLFDFGLSVVMFCFMVTSFFKSASLGAVCAVIIYLIFFMPYVIVISLEAILTFPQKIITSLFMSTGFCYTVLLMARYEVQGIGLQWSNINESPLIDDPISVANMCLIILFDAFLYFLLGYIINNIRFRDNINIDVITSNLVSTSLPIGVRIENVTKVYKNKKKTHKALDNVNIDLHKGHITTLLGHNGAGKTTLIKILTGEIRANHGKIIINKQNITEVDVEKKNHIGLCPQNDVLLEFMSSREHLIYYARLKTNSSHSQVEYDVESMLKTIGLNHLAEEPVYRLSGGLRRRLCVGLAFISNPHLVILDEPSSGVDPMARRDIWSLILNLKQNRTVLLTTHHLDEAELLSDTLIIMHKGKVLTKGSPLELKQKHGSGYNLTITYPLNALNNMDINRLQLNKKNDVEYLHNIITKETMETHEHLKKLFEYVQTAVVNSVFTSFIDNTVQINLPFLNAHGQQNDFTSLMRLLEDKKTELKYVSLSIECSTMEQVFIDICKEAKKVNEESNKGRKTAVDNSSLNSNIDSYLKKEEDMHFHKPWLKSRKLRGSPWRQFLTLLMKRFMHYRRNYRLLIITLLLPTVFVAFAMGFSLIRPPNDSENPLDLSSTMYNKFSVEFASLSPEMDSIDENIILRSLTQKSLVQNNRTIYSWNETSRCCSCIDGYQKCNIDNDTNFVVPENIFTVLPSTKRTNNWIVNTQDLFTEKRYGGWSSSQSGKDTNNSNRFIVWYNNKGDHALPAYLNTLNNEIFKYITKNDDVRIITYNHPLKLSVNQLSRSTIIQHVADVGIGVVLLVGFALVPAGGVIYLVNERTSQEKRLQLLCGVSPFTYWISTLIWDVLIIIGATILAIGVVEIFALPVYLYRQNIPAICLLLLLYGISCSALMHILEKFFTDASLANMILFCANVFIGVIGLTILLIIDVLSTSEYMDTIRWNLHKFFLIFPQFALGDGLVEISKNTILATVLSRFEIDTYLSPLGWELMGAHYSALAITALTFFSINLLYEYDLLDSLISMFQKKYIDTIEDDMKDYDVITEKHRVELDIFKSYHNMGFDGHETSIANLHDPRKNMNKNDILQIFNLRKVYRGVLENRVAVDGLSFGVKPGRCFGLLGINGAGKSTTFKILTGETKATSGRIFIGGKLVSSRQLCNGSIAYCPQTDSLDPYLSIVEHLEFYFDLRGLEKNKRDITNVIEEFDLTKYKNQPSHTLSGGNRRKLCTAISFAGNSPIVLLDEPTSGMDPGARHKIGNAVRRAADAGRCLLLSSHSLTECEFLCERVGVMAMGKFLAIGAPERLKRKYGGGYLVSMRLGAPDTTGRLARIVSELFPRALIDSFHGRTVQLTVTADEDRDVGDVFRVLSEIRSRFDIVDYSVNSTSLDQVLMNLSSVAVGRRAEPSNDVYVTEL